MASLTEMLGGRFDPQQTAGSVFKDVHRRYPETEITFEESVQTVLELAQDARITTFIAPLDQKALGDKARAQEGTQQKDPNITTPSQG